MSHSNGQKQPKQRSTNSRTSPVLKTFDNRYPITVITDASKIAIGAVLEQDHPTGRHPVAYTSRTLNPSERNYAAHDLELLGIVDTLRAWRCYLYGRRFTIHTDHDPLRYLETQKRLSPRQVRWIERLLDFDFILKPIKGKSNRVADALSRQGTQDDNGAYAQQLLKDLRKKTLQINAVSIVMPSEAFMNTMQHGYAHDPEFAQEFRNPTGSFTLVKGLLYKEGKLCIPKGQHRMDLLHDYHSTPSAGHLGETKTRNRLQPLYYWKALRQDVHNYVRGCRTCQATKARNHKPFGFLQPIPPPETKWQVITMDFITPLPETKNGHTGILNIVCKLSKMIRIICLPKQVDALLVAKLFKEHIYRHHGLPQKIISDRDSIFMSKFWTSLFKTLGTRLAPSTAYHPESDGQTEIANRKVEEMIRAFANYRKDNWDEHIVDFEVAYNSAVNSTTLCSPFYLTYGIHPRTIPIETLASSNPSVAEFLKATVESTKFAQDHIKKQNNSMAEYANRFRKQHSFKVGDKVWLSTKNISLEDGSGTRKLHPKFCGPLEISEKINDVTFRLLLSEPMKLRRIHDTFHVSLLKPYVEDTFGRNQDPPPPLQFADGHQEYEVEEILAHRKKHGKSQFLVKWKGYPDHENSWEPEQNLENSQALLAKYQASRRSPD